MTRIGYVLKVYPRFSETFIVTEILAREAHGDDLRIYALRPTTCDAASPNSRPTSPACPPTRWRRESPWRRP